MGNFRESYVTLDTLKQVGQRAAVKRTYAGAECVVYEFLLSLDDDDDGGGGGEDVVATVYNVPMKRVFKSKYRWATFYRNDCRVVLTLVANGIPTTGSESFEEGELSFGSTHVSLRDDDDNDENNDQTDIVFSFSTTPGHIPTLLVQDQKSKCGSWTFSLAVLLLSAAVIYYNRFVFCYQELNWVNQLMKRT